MGSFSILTNVASLQSQNYLQTNSNFQTQTIDEVSSGLRIVNSGNDAAGLAIANGFRSNEAVLTQGIQNANNGLAELQTADGGLSNISQLLDRARTLATESASGTFTGDRSVLDGEFQSVLTEINRQAQAIGLTQGGSLAQKLSVFIGGGQAGNGVTATQNGSIGVDLSQSAVDTQSLGLTGVQATGAAGTDIGAGSATTSLSAILANATNTGTEATPGYTTFNITGPGFAGNGVNITVNTANLSSTSDLVAAINAAITAAGAGGTQQATALSNAGIIAGINTDSTGKQQLTFASSSTAFQVRAGDQVANALLGNFAQNATLTGTDAGPTVDTNTGGTSATLTLAVDGGSAFSVGVTASAATSKAQIVKDLNANSSFNAVATAHLDGDQIVLQSDNNTVHSEIQITGTTLATNLGLSTTAATSANPSTGASLNTYVTAANNTAAGATTFGAAGAGTITFQFQGAGQTTPTNVALNVTAGTTVTQAIAALNTAVSGNAALQAAGITLNTSTATDALGFTANSGQSFNVQVTGDTQDLLGFGSFVTGANGAVNYNSLGASSDYNDATAVGTNTFEFSLNGAASNANAVAVDLTAGDATAATLTSTDTSGAPVEVTANNNVLNLAVNGQSFTVTLTPGGDTTKNSIADQINTAIAAQGTATVVNNAIVIASNTKGAGGSVQIQNGINDTANTLLGLAAGASATGTSRSGASVAQALNQYFASNSSLQAAGLVADYNVTTPNRITIQSSNDTFFRVNSFGDTASAATEGSIQEGTQATAGAQTSSVTASTVVAGTSSDFNIAIDGGAVHNITLSAGVARTAQSIATELNGNALFAGATASVDGTGHLIISSNTTGAGSSIALTAGTHDALGVLGLTATTSTGVAASAGYDITGANDAVSVSIDGGAAQTFTLTNGANQTTADIATDLAGLVGATASDDNGHLNITSNSTGTGSSVLFNATANSAYATLGITAGTTYSGSAAQTGFGDTGVTFTGNIDGAAPTTSPSVDVGGASQTAALAFAPIANGGDNQTISISAADSTGAQQSLSVTLSDNGTSRNGESIDQALNSINTALLQSNNSTLQQIVAVKDDSAGSEQIRFLSTLPAFQVSIGSTPDAAGIGSQGTTAASTVSNGGSTADIGNITSATAAVTALANATTLLGNSQAVVGRGENQFNYAINLAQSQLTNEAAAESTIRDANLATESANLTKAQILLQAGVAALAQANSAPENLLKLLQ
jgi:flagellin